MNSKRKGKDGELEAAKELRRVLGATARRGQQFSGTQDSPDIVHNIEGVHFEVKRTERLRLYAALEQADGDRGAGEIPIVLHRANDEPWVVIVELNDLPALVESIHRHFTRTINVTSGAASTAALAESIHSRFTRV